MINGLIIMAFVCYGFAMLGAGALLWEHISHWNVISKAIDEFLSTLPMMDEDT